MEIQHLKYFYFVAKEGGFSKASRALRIAQPAISKMVKNLEEDFGSRLLERNGRSVRLTKSGSDVFRKCELIFKHFDEIRALGRSGDGGVRGSLCIGAAEPVANHMLPSILKGFLKKYPDVYPQIICGSASENIKLLVAKKITLALLFHAPELPESVKILREIPISYKLVVSTKFKRSEKVCSSFIGSREVDDEANKFYPTLAVLRQQHPEAEIKISTNAVTAHRQMVLDGLGVAILPEFLVQDDIKTKKLTVLFTQRKFQFNLKI